MSLLNIAWLAYTLPERDWFPNDHALPVFGSIGGVIVSSSTFQEPPVGVEGVSAAALKAITVSLVAPSVIIVPPPPDPCISLIFVG